MGTGLVRAGSDLPSHWDAYLSDVLAHVLDDHLIGCDGLHGEQTPVMDVAFAELELFLAELWERRRG